MAAAVVVPIAFQVAKEIAVPMAIELLKLGNELLREHRENGGTLTPEQEAALAAEHVAVSREIAARNLVPAPPR